MNVQKFFILHVVLALVLASPSASIAKVTVIPETSIARYYMNLKEHGELASEWLPHLFCPVGDLSYEDQAYSPSDNQVHYLNEEEQLLDYVAKQAGNYTPQKYIYLYLFPSDVDIDEDDKKSPNRVVQLFQDWDDSIWKERLARDQSGEKYDLAERVCKSAPNKWGDDNLFYWILNNQPKKIRLLISDQQNLSPDLSTGSHDVHYGIPILYYKLITEINNSWKINNLVLKFKSLYNVNFQGLSIFDSSIYLENTANLNFRGALLKNVDLHGSFSFHQLSSTKNGSDLYTMSDDVRLWMDHVPEDWHEEAWLNYNPETGVFDVSRKPWRAIPSTCLDSNKYYVRDERYSFLASLDAFASFRNSNGRSVTYSDIYKGLIKDLAIFNKDASVLEKIKGDAYFILPNTTTESFFKLKTEKDGDLSNFIFFPDEKRDPDREYSLEGWDLSNLDLTNAKLRRLNLTDVNFTNSIISFCSFEGSWGLTAEQIKSTWNWKTGRTSDIIFPRELLQDAEIKSITEVQ